MISPKVCYFRTYYTSILQPFKAVSFGNRISPGQVRLGKHTGPEGAYMFSVGWKPDLAIKERIRKNDHYVEQSP